MSSTDLLNTGTVCSHEACWTIDFLPFKCSHCALSFCTEHWRPTDHDCKKYDAAKEDRIVPQCPFCSKPVLVAPQQDPNIPMERHIEQDCVVLGGKKNRGPVCGNRKCGKSLITPIVCQTCKGQFCPTHRFPNTHTCRPAANASPSTSKASNTTTTTPTSTTPSGIAALKRAAAAASTSATAKINSATTTLSSPPSKTPKVSNGGGNKPTLLKEIKTDRCEPSSSSALSSPPTAPMLPTSATALNAIPLGQLSSSAPRPSPEPKRMTIVPDPTKKWVPTALFASA